MKHLVTRYRLWDPILKYKCTTNIVVHHPSKSLIFNTRTHYNDIRNL